MLDMLDLAVDGIDQSFTDHKSAGRGFTSSTS